MRDKFQNNIPTFLISHSSQMFHKIYFPHKFHFYTQFGTKLKMILFYEKKGGLRILTTHYTQR